VPMIDVKPGLGQAAITEDEVMRIRQVMAAIMASSKLPNIDPFDGIKFTVFPPGFNLQPEAEVSFSVYGHADRLANGPQRVKDIADQVSAILGYVVFVWAEMGGQHFDARSDEPLPDPED
jgi:hypothetical protein